MVLSIDPGKTTGVALFDNSVSRSGSVKLTYVRCFETYNYDAIGLCNLKPPVNVDELIIETPPQNGNDTNLIRLYGVVCAHYAQSGTLIHQLNPGLWKPIVKRLKLDIPRRQKMSRHERDAYNMARVWERYHQ